MRAPRGASTRLIAQNPRIQTSSLGGNGKNPPSPNNAAAPMPSTDPASGSARRQPMAGNQAAAASNRKAPASGLAALQRIASANAHQRLRSFTAARAPMANATPSA